MNETTIIGKTFKVGDELVMRFGNGTQKVRIREITKSGAVKIDRFNGSRALWVPVKAPVKNTDERFIGRAIGR